MTNQEKLREMATPQDSMELVDLIEASSPADFVPFLRKLNPGEKLTKTFGYTSIFGKPINLTDVTRMVGFVDRLNMELRQYGEGIGRGNEVYGFKMPLPKKGDTERELIIFKRR